MVVPSFARDKQTGTSRLVGPLSFQVQERPFQFGYAFFKKLVASEIGSAHGKKSPGFKKRMQNLADMMMEEKLFWQQEIPLIQERLFKPFRSGRLLDLEGLLRYSAAVQRRVLRRSLGGDLLTFDAVERLREWMQSPPSGGRLWQLKQGWIVERLSKSSGFPSAKLFWFKQSKMKIRKENNSHEKI